MRERFHIVCHFIAAYFFLVILMAAFGANTLFTEVGRFLFERFNLASLYIPGLIMTGGIMLQRPQISRASLAALWLSPTVFITLALALQVALGNDNYLGPGILAGSLGRFPAASLLFLLSAVEIVLLCKLAAIDRQWMKQVIGDLHFRMKDIIAFFGLMEPETEADAEGIQDDLPIMAQPDFPDIPESLKDSDNLVYQSTDAPEKPPKPGSLEANPSVSELIQRVLSDTEKDLEQNHDKEDISSKLDPQGHEPKGVIAGKIREQKNRMKVYSVPVEGVLADYPESDFSAIDESTRRGAGILEQTLKEFKIEARVTGIRRGPVITMYELLPSPGVKISSIVNLQDNIALRLAASRVRMVAPIPGKHAIGIEVPNKNRAIVSFSSLVDSEEFRSIDTGIPVILGKDISGGNQVIDLTRTPHLLIAGATGSGKSVCVNSLIGSILYSRSPREVKMIMIDPKIVELKLYNDIPHLLTSVITEPKRAIQALQWCLYEMERRYSLLDSQGVRDITSFNKKLKTRNLATEELPFIVVIVDEFADLMATSGKALEAIVARLAAMSRAVGIHLVLATQRPSVDVITGLIKANFPSRIAFMVAGKTDSRIIIDAMGADKLLGRGDMLFTSAWDPFPSRMQGAFLAEEEVERMAEYVKTLGEPDYIDEEMFFDDEENQDLELESANGDDPLYEQALEIVIKSRKASASYLQRCLKIGYNRAARLVEDMEQRGIVGPANGSKPREIIHIPDKYLSTHSSIQETSTV